MSTKLYDGIIIDGNSYDFWDVVSRMRETLESVFSQLSITYTQDLLSSCYVDYVTKMNSHDKNVADNSGSALWFLAIQRLKDEKEEFFKDKLFCRVQLFEPLDDGRILGYVFSHNQPEYYDAVCSLPFVKEFGYWNNTDAPDGISDTEWMERQTLWSHVLDKSFYLTGTGVSITLPDTENRALALPNELTQDFTHNYYQNINRQLSLNAILREVCRIYDGNIFDDFGIGVVSHVNSFVIDHNALVFSKIPKFDTEFLLLPLGDVELPTYDPVMINALARSFIAEYITKKKDS